MARHNNLFLVLVCGGAAFLGYGIYRYVRIRSDKPTYGEAQVAMPPFPVGYRRLTQQEVTPELTSAASAIRDASGFTSTQYGTVIPIDGNTAALIEQHYHEPLGPMKPWGYHHGVTLIRPV